MASQEYITFRPRKDQEASYAIICDWCSENNHPISSIINSFIDAIAYSLIHSTFFDEETQRFYIRSDFGDVPIFNIKKQFRKPLEKLIDNERACIRLNKGRKKK